MVVLLFVYNSARTRTELLGTNLDIWIISVGFSSFLALPYPDSKTNCPGKGLNQLPRLVLFQEKAIMEVVLLANGSKKKNQHKNCLFFFFEKEQVPVL